MYRTPLRNAARLASALALACALLPSTPSYAAGPIGGPQLGGKGDVLDRRPGVLLPPAVAAAGWLVADLDTGAVLGARNPHGRFLPASTLKTLTALALLPKLSPRTVVKPSKLAANMEGSRVGIKAGHPLTVEFLFTGMLINSGNDTAVALAEAAGGEATTVRLMNQQLKRIQARDTLAANSTGLDATDQFSSPYDLALIGREALKNPDYRRYIVIKKTMVPTPKASFEIANKNRLLYTYDGSFGGKTGRTVRAGSTYVGYAQRGSRRLVVTLMKTTDWAGEATKLLDWGFAAADRITPVGQLVPALDAVTSATASASAVASAGNASPAGSSSPMTSQSADSGPPAVSAPGGASAPLSISRAARPEVKRRALFDRLPATRWWYAAGALALVGMVTTAVILRNRRRRRRGFYMPQTKLRLPVR